MSTVRFLSLLVLLGVVGGIAVVLGGSDLMEEAMDRRLRTLRKDLIRARSHASDLEELGQSRSLTDILEGLNQETDEEELTQQKSNTDDENVDERGLKDADDDDDEIDGSDVSDTIFYVAVGLADEIKATCNIDIAAIFTGYSPATLAAANDAGTKLSAATKALSDVLASSPGFADDLQTFVDSKTFKPSDVPSNIDKAFAKIDKTLSSVENKVFCAQAQLIATRLQMALFGGIGFANGYMCNKVFVELVRYHLNATKLLEASKSEEDFVKNCTKNLIEDITCYEKELEAYNKILPTTTFTAASPLQTVAFTADFLIDYGVILMYHRVVLQLEAEVVKLCASGNKDDGKDDKKKEVENLEEDTESLTDQLQKLLKKLNEVSAKKKEAQLALSGRTGVHTSYETHDNEPEDGDESEHSPSEDTDPVMPSAGEKMAIKKSYYRERED